MTQTLDEMKALVTATEGLENKPFVLINSQGQEFQAYWLDVWMGAFIVPQITETKVFHIRQLDGQGCVVRHLMPEEPVDEKVAKALEIRIPI